MVPLCHSQTWPDVGKRYVKRSDQSFCPFFAFKRRLGTASLSSLGAYAFPRSPVSKSRSALRFFGLSPLVSSSVLPLELFIQSRTVSRDLLHQIPRLTPDFNFTSGFQFERVYDTCLIFLFDESKRWRHVPLAFAVHRCCVAVVFASDGWIGKGGFSRV